MKDRKTYKILTLLGLAWVIPLNRMYLGEPWGWRVVTFNYFYIGAVLDLFYMDKRFDEAVARRGYVDITRRG